ncbi:MAG TPA: hypothetical protein VF796_27465, partial [Humisphaera sp.]
SVPPAPSRRRFGRRRAFTLIEAAWVTVIVGVGCLAMMTLLAAGTQSNAAGNEITVAVNLANNIHEISYALAFADPQNPTQWVSRESSPTLYDNITDLDGQTFSPPLDVRRLPLTEYSTWAQKVKVETVAPDMVYSTRTNDVTTPTARVTVQILHNGKVVHTCTWLAVGPSPG